MSLSPDDDLIHDRSIDYPVDDNDTMNIVVLGVSDETPVKPSGGNDSTATPSERTPKRVVHLSPQSWDMLDDHSIPTPSAGTIPIGAHSIYDYLSVLEEVSPDLHVVETMLLLDGWSMSEVATGYGVPRSTVMRWRAKGHKLYQEWRSDSAHEKLPHNALSRQVYTQWQDGASAAVITVRLNMPAREVRRMIQSFIANGSTRPSPRLPAPRPSPQQRGGYAAGDRMRERILAAITVLAHLKGEPPTGREIQAEIGARSKIDYHLTQMKAQGFIRMANGGRGYEVVSPELIGRPKFKRTR